MSMRTKEFRLILTILFTLLGMQAKAEDKVVIQSAEISAGDEFYLPIYLENELSYKAFQMEIVLPEGISPVYETTYDEDEEEYVTSLGLGTANRFGADHSVSNNYQASENILSLVCVSFGGKKFKNSNREDPLFSIKLKVDENMRGGDYTIKLQNNVFTDADSNGHTFADATATFTVEGSTPPAQVTIDTDLTSQFNSLATTKWEGSSGQVGWAAPQVTTNSGLTVAAWESYCGDWNGGCTNTGEIMYTTVSGLTAGTYKIELYGAAAFTFNRNFGSEAFTGDITVGNGSKATSDTYEVGQSIDTETGVFLYATTSEGTYEQEIPIWYADNFNGSGLSTAVLNGVVVGEDGNIRIGMKKTSQSTNWHVVQLKGVTATVNADALFSSFKSEAEALYESPMNAAVLSELQAAANVDLSSAGADEYITSIETLQTKISAANTSIANYVEAKSILDAANQYDEAGQASYAANETIAAIQTAYTDRTLEALTSDQESAAKTAYDYACKAQIHPADGCDMTPYIVNPSFESEFTGWSNYGMATQNNTSFAKDGNIYVERWQPNGTFGISQAINVPAGVYRLSAKCLARGVISAKIYGGSEETSITIEDASNTYSVDFNCADKATIGFEGEGDGAGSSWLCVDNFQLTYVRQLTAEEIEVIAKENAKAAYDEALAAAQAFEEGTIPSTAYSNLQTVITNNTLEDGSSSDYNAAAVALNEAAAANRPLVAPYSAWKALKTQGDALVEVSTNNVEKKETLSSAISELNNTVEAATTFDEIIPATSSLRTAMIIYATTAQPTNDECFDLTFMIENQHFTEGAGGRAVPNGWTLESGEITEHRLITHNFEAFHTPFNLSQTIPNLPKGTYKVTLQGFARHDDANVTNKTNLYCGVVNQEIKDIKAEWSTTSFYSSEQASMGDNNRDSQYQRDDVTVYQPNGMTGAYYWFQQINTDTDQPFYTNEVQTLITEDGDLKIGFKCETNTDWVIWDNFHLYYYGSAIAVTIDENADNSTYSKDIENANVTLKRTIKPEKWNTFVVPFDIDNATLKEKFGNEVEVAVYIECQFGDSKNSTVNFTKLQADERKIDANIPVLLWTPEAESTYTFYGVTLKTGEPIMGGINYDFVGSYAASITLKEGDYFIGENSLGESKLWEANPDKTTLKGTRAYLKPKNAEAGARIIDFRIGERETTGIVSINNGVKSIDNATFDLQGRKVTNVKKGLYIKNSKKVVVK